MVRIRLRRAGGKGQPTHRVVAANRESPRDGKYLENVGTYDPLIDPAKVTLKTERIQYWMGQGAKPSDTVRSLLKKEGFFAAAT